MRVRFLCSAVVLVVLIPVLILVVVLILIVLIVVLVLVLVLLIHGDYLRMFCSWRSCRPPRLPCFSGFILWLEK